MTELKYVSYALTAASVSAFLGFLSRYSNDALIPLFLIRALIVGALIYAGKKQESTPLVLLGMGGTIGLIIGHWDEFSIIWKYQFYEVLMVPIVVIVVVIMGVTFYAIKPKN